MAPAPRVHLTPSALAGHLACRHLTQLDRRRHAGESIPILPDPRREALVQRGHQHERAYVARLEAGGRSVRDLRGSGAVAATLEAMRAGVGAIVQAPLGDGTWSGIADVLLRADTPSTLGPWSYEPADTKLARETKAGTILQLCAYAEFLESLQGTPPRRVHVITPHAEEQYKTVEFVAYYRSVRAAFLAASTMDPPPDTYPEPVPHCDVCSYWRVCAVQRRADDHLSLVADMRTTHLRELQRQRVTTVSALAADGLAGPPLRGSPANFARLREQARLQVAARSQELPPVETLPVIADAGLARLPAPTVGDVFLDFEGDPFVGDGGLEYLTGWCVDDGDGDGELRYEARWAITSDEEKAAAETFLDFVAARLRQHPDLHVYHFGSYEPAALKRLCARHDSRREALDVLLRGRRFVDLHTIVRESLRIGVERYGLKELEALHGFTRTLGLSDASHARLDLELALELGDTDRIDPTLRGIVAAYNRDDCDSTASLRTWLEGRRAELVATGTSISRPVPGEGTATESVGERDRRIGELQRALLANLPPDSAQRSETDDARALLASMLGYFRQEEKNAWWEHFRLRELPPDERLDEREMLAGLEFAGVEPKIGRQRNVRHRYRFPPQDTALDPGDTVYFTADEDPVGRDKSTRMTVESLDAGAGIVVLSMGKAAAQRHPSAVFREQVIDAGGLEESLLDFASHVQGHDFAADGPFAATGDLLLRRPPRRRVGVGPLRGAGESTLDAIRRLCAELDRGVLPVQGPPGTGKTYSGARAIVALARAGKRVGVTAVSHKVIDNLLEAVQRAALESGQPLRLVHKHCADPPAGIEYVEDTGDALAAIAPGTVVGGTAWLWADPGAVQTIDHLFVDEAGQMALAQALATARAARNLVLLGDPQQLDQPTRGAHPPGADVAALVHVIGPGRATLGDEQGLFLDRTFRLHPTLCSFTSDLYYDGRVAPQNADSSRRRLLGPTPFAGAGFFLLEVAHEGNQAQSPEEVDAVAGVVHALLRPDVHWCDKQGVTRSLAPNDILVVAPYNAQVSALRRRLADHGVTRVGTVDKFQGQEAPVVVYSCTSSSPHDAPRGMAFLYDPHRFNVATSRAEGVVIVAGNAALFAPDCRTPEQARAANGFCRFREVAQRIELASLI